MPQPTPELRADFLEWLKTGSFRGVSLGMTLKDVVKPLGPEQRRWESEYGITLRWNESPVDLTFDVETGLLWQQEINLLQSEVRVTLFGNLNDFSPQVVAHFLECHSISFEIEHTPKTGKNDLKFKLPHAIEFSFFDESEKGQPLELCLIDQTNTLLPHLIVTHS